jgi:hypothetical protein
VTLKHRPTLGGRYHYYPDIPSRINVCRVAQAVKIVLFFFYSLSRTASRLGLHPGFSKATAGQSLSGYWLQAEAAPDQDCNLSEGLAVCQAAFKFAEAIEKQCQMPYQRLWGEV